MKLQLRTSLLVSAFACTTLSAQNTPVKEGTAYQNTLRFEQSVSPEQALSAFVTKNKLPKGTTFQPVYTNADRTGALHQKFQQYHKGIKVQNGVVITHSRNNETWLANGELYTVTVSGEPSFSKEEAFGKAVSQVNAITYLWEEEAQAKLMNYSKPEGELVFYPNVVTGKVALAYKFDIFALAPISRQEIYIDAHSGDYLGFNPIIKHAHRLIPTEKVKENNHLFEKAITALATGNAETRFSGTRQIETTFDGSQYVLQDYTRGNGIVTLNLNRAWSLDNVTDFYDNDNNWTADEHKNTNRDDGALDAHWGAEVTYDFWKNHFGRESYDGNGSILTSYVHLGQNFSNAMWGGSMMIYGDGDAQYNIFTALDVCGHEIGHGVCEYTANLVYERESGAMNEGFSDIWGACIEHFGRTGSLDGEIAPIVWRIGEDIMSSALRNMQDPNTHGDPNTYLGTYWQNASSSCTPSDNNDSCGVHTNSGVLNHWFYILTVGKSGTNNAPTPATYDVEGIGMYKAAEIAYIAERDYLTPNSNYLDLRNATIEIANMLYCSNSPEAKAVTDAWYAVNLGEPHTGVDFDIALQQINGASELLCGANSIELSNVIKNQGLNEITSVEISYAVDGGATQTETWNGSLGLCDEATFPITISGFSRGAHTVQVTTTTDNDGRAENNTKTIQFYSNDEGEIGVINAFSTTEDELIVIKDGTGGSWVRAIRTSGSMNSGTGNYVYTTNASGNYLSNTKTYLVSQCYNLTTVTEPQISFSMKYDLEESYDVAYVQYSTNFGGTWNVLGTKTADWYNSDISDCNACKGAQWTGTNTTEATYSYPLNELAGQQNVIFRIVFHSDESQNRGGVNIDNFVINGALSADNFTENNVAVYPNPSTGVFNIAFGTLAPQSITVYDISGKTLYNNSVESSVTHTSLNLSKAAQGVYFVKIVSQNGQSVVKRIVKE